MNRFLPSLLLFALLLRAGLYAQQRATPAPFPGWASKTSPAPGGATDKTDFLGEWEGFITEGDGSNPSQRRGNIALNIGPDSITATGAGNMGGGTYKLSGTGKLRRIDATGTSGQYQGKQYEGIVTVEGNTLKWCSGNPGKGRPAAFKTNTGAGHFLMVLTRKS